MVRHCDLTKPAPLPSLEIGDGLMNIRSGLRTRMHCFSPRLFLLIVIGICIAGGIGALTWPYTINTWLEYTGKEAAFTALGGFVLGCVPVIGQLSIPGAAGTWICTFFIDDLGEGKQEQEN